MPVSRRQGTPDPGERDVHRLHPPRRSTVAFNHAIIMHSFRHAFRSFVHSFDHYSFMLSSPIHPYAHSLLFSCHSCRPFTHSLNALRLSLSLIVASRAFPPGRCCSATASVESASASLAAWPSQSPLSQARQPFQTCSYLPHPPVQFAPVSGPWASLLLVPPKA